MSDPNILRKATFMLCVFNAAAVLYLIYVLFGPLYFGISNSISQSVNPSSQELEGAVGVTSEGVNHVEAEDLKQLREEADALRIALQPLAIINRVKEIQAEGEAKQASDDAAKEKRKAIAMALAGGKEGEVTKDGLLAGLDKLASLDAADLDKVLKEEATHLAANDDIPGPALSPQCGMEKHTDLDGVAVAWGLTHLTETANDCCQACLKHATSAKEGEKKCNTWVYCPKPTGCWSPDIYEHKHKECWLKQADQRKVNFQGEFYDDFRLEHTTAPSMVEWVAGRIRN